MTVSQAMISWKESESHSVVSDSVTPRTTAPQAPLSMEFSRQEYWSGLSFPSLGDLPDPGLLHSRQILYCLNHQRFLWQIPKSVVHERKKKKKIRLFSPFKMQRLQKAGCEKQVFPLISAFPPASSTHPAQSLAPPGPACVRMAHRHARQGGSTALCN